MAASMATTTFGNVEGILTLLRRDLFQIRYHGVFDEAAARLGRFQALLPVLGFILTRFSKHVAAKASSYNLAGRRGKTYIQNVFKLAREVFNMRIVLNSSQFLAEGYAERKLMFVHQLIVSCREYHSTAVRQERLGMLQENQDISMKQKAAAAGGASELKLQKKEHTTENTGKDGRSQSYINNTKESHGSSEVFLTPEEPRQLPRNLISTFNEATKAATAAAAVEEKDEDEGQDGLEKIHFTNLEIEESCSSSDIEQTRGSDINEEEINYRQTSTPTPAPEWWQDFLQLAQDTKDISARMQTLEFRLEQTNTQLMSLQISSKAHAIVLEDRILAMQRQLHQDCQDQKMPANTHPCASSFLDQNALKMAHSDTNNHYTWENERESGIYMRLSDFYTNHVSSRHSELMNSSLKYHRHPRDRILSIPSRAVESEQHLFELKRTEADDLDPFLDNKDSLIGNPMKNRYREGEKDEFDRSGEDGGGGGSLKENFQQNVYHQHNRDMHTSLNSQDVLLSLRARLAEAQILLKEAHTALHLSPP